MSKGKKKIIQDNIDKITSDDLIKAKEKLWSIANGEVDLNPIQTDTQIKALKVICDIEIAERKLNINKIEPPKDIKIVLLGKEERDEQAKRLKDMEESIKNSIDENGHLVENKDNLF